MFNWTYFTNFDFSLYIDHKKYGKQFEVEFIKLLLKFEYFIDNLPNFCDSCCCGSNKSRVRSVCMNKLKQII